MSEVVKSAAVELALAEQNHKDILLNQKRRFIADLQVCSEASIAAINNIALSNQAQMSEINQAMTQILQNFDVLEERKSL
jgi:hypothetical protein